MGGHPSFGNIFVATNYIFLWLATLFVRPNIDNYYWTFFQSEYKYSYTFIEEYIFLKKEFYFLNYYFYFIKYFNLLILIGLGIGAVFLWKRYGPYKIVYKGFLFFIILFSFIFSTPILFALLLLKNTTVHFSKSPVFPSKVAFQCLYKGSWGWVIFWAIYFLPIALLLLLIKGIEIEQLKEEDEDTINKEKNNESISTIENK